jgi:hypothetical protein
MTSAVDNLVLELVDWVNMKERSYQEALDAWRTSCPKLPIWEEAIDRELLQRDFANGRWLVRVTPAGLALLQEHRGMSPTSVMQRSES